MLRPNAIRCIIFGSPIKFIQAQLIANLELKHVVIDEGDLLHVRTQNPELRTYAVISKYIAYNKTPVVQNPVIY